MVCVLFHPCNNKSYISQHVYTLQNSYFETIQIFSSTLQANPHYRIECQVWSHGFQQFIGFDVDPIMHLSSTSLCDLVQSVTLYDLIDTWSNGGSKGFQFYQITCLECWRNIFLHILQRGKVFRPKNIKVSKQSNHAFTQASKGWHPWKEVYQMMRYRLGSWSLYTRSWYVCTHSPFYTFEVSFHNSFIQIW